jgi:hypothetical protein
MSLTELLERKRKDEAPRRAITAQRQWVEKGTVPGEYIRSEVSGSYCSRTAVADLVRKAVTFPDCEPKE